jgi:hypothetical protein
MKTGEQMQGVRWHSSYDPIAVRTIVEKKLRESISYENVDQIDVVPTARTTGESSEPKILTP